MDFGAPNAPMRMVGDYIIGPRIGSGSFAVVWRSRHRVLGTEFAIKEIDKKHLNDNLKKEISILGNVSHPNIIRLYEAIETEGRIFLVLEYCDGGDLGAYIQRHGRVSEDVARHFIKQLAAGLQVLRDNNLIHRDLKPQNLLLSGKGVNPLLKIGDFGFARYLTPQGLADTLCGSPLYMAPEIIQNQRYDAKADLWSVGAILYQLVIGKPPFDGNSQLQLFQNILTSTELRFPEGSLKVLHPDFVELCRSLLRRNPVERLTFEEFFNHRFLKDPGAAELSAQISRVDSVVLTDVQKPQSHHEDKFKASDGSAKGDRSCVNDKEGDYRKFHGSTSSTRDVCGVMSRTSTDKIKQSAEIDSQPPSQIQVADSLECIEREYVLVLSNFASMEILTSSLGTSTKESSNSKACPLAPNNREEQPMPIAEDSKGLAAKFVASSASASCSGMDVSTASGEPHIPREAQGLTTLHPSTRLYLLHQYISTLSDLAQEKLNAGLFMESFSLQLIILAIWKEILRMCSSWLLSSREGSDLPGSSSGNDTPRKGASSTSETYAMDFTNPSSASVWAEHGFILSYDRTEKLSKYLRDVDGAAEMPDAMEIIYQTALEAGRNGAAAEFLGNRESAAAMYSRALLLFSFIVGEAPSLPLNPPFLLAPENKQHILKYMKNLESHLSRSHMSQPSSEQLHLFTK